MTYITDPDHPAIATTYDLIETLLGLDHRVDDKEITALAKAVWPEHDAGVHGEVVTYDGRLDPEEPFKGVTEAKFKGATVTVDHTTLFTDFKFASDTFEVSVPQYDAGERYSVPTFNPGVNRWCFAIEIIRGDADAYVDWAKRAGTLLKMFGDQ